MAFRLPDPIRTVRARRVLRAERASADCDLLETELPPLRLAWRVRELVSDAHRLDVAASITSVVHAADSAVLPGASPLNRVAVRSSRANLLALAARLADLDRPVTPRGVLLAERLVSHSSSPLYDRTAAAAAPRRADDARYALERHGAL